MSDISVLPKEYKIRMRKTEEVALYDVRMSVVRTVIQIFSNDKKEAMETVAFLQDRGYEFEEVLYAPPVRDIQEEWRHLNVR